MIKIYVRPLILLGISVFLACAGGDHKHCSISSLNGRCPRHCIQVDRQSWCYHCKEGCNTSITVATCNPQDPSSCGGNQTCLSVGTTGIHKCVNRIREGERCSEAGAEDSHEDGDDEADEVMSFKKRFPTSTLQKGTFTKASINCRQGLVCRREDIDQHTCRQKPQTACTQKRGQHSDVSCSNQDGAYSPLQCTTTRSGQKECRCVSKNGTDIDGTKKIVSTESDIPDCGNRRCRFQSSQGVQVEAASQTVFINSQRCQKCLCEDGEQNHCHQLSKDACKKIDPNNRPSTGCTIRGGTNIKEGVTIEIGCKKCRCFNGRLSCVSGGCSDTTHQEDDMVDDMDENRKACAACRGEPISPVCGKDGRTYFSSCFAMKCRGLSSEDIVPGRCDQRNICEAHRCNDSHVCVKREGVTCLSKKGCRNSDRLRTCVDLENLKCDSKSDERGEQEVCGHDGKTYPSHCELLQTAVGVGIKHRGSCSDDRCSSGEVCGADGKTYSSICELWTKSARLDYKGVCEEIAPNMMERDRCSNIRRRKRCRDVSDCKTAVQLGDGCCPICGGGLTVGYDKEALENYLELNPSFETVTDFERRILMSDIISKEDLKHCNVTASLLDEGDLFIAFESLKESEDYCMRLAGKIESLINNPPHAGAADTVTTFSSLPQELQFATVAQSSAAITPEGTDGNKENGGQATVQALSKIGIFIFVLMISVLL